MLDIPKNITGITHPLINEMYMKKDYNSPKGTQSVLVIQAKHRQGSDQDQSDGGFDSYLTDILTDLNDLTSQAQTQIGHFDRIDIRHY